MITNTQYNISNTETLFPTCRRFISSFSFLNSRSTGISGRSLRVSDRTVEAADIIPNTEGGQVSLVEIDNDQFQMHAFTDVGTSTFRIDADGVADVLIVGGGGGGGGDGGGGGGGGGVVFEEELSVEAGSYAVTVGAGGAGNEAKTGIDSSNNGDDSIAFGLTALGGGAGGNFDGEPPQSGGSGGGGDRETEGASSLQQASPDGGFGNPGGNGNPDIGGAGGGGAAQSGGDATAGQDGGNGKNYSAKFGTQFGENGYFGGGGAGGHENSGTAGGTGGLGGGGGSTGIITTSGSSKITGGTNTGGGGGGATGSGDAIGGDGGSGIILIRLGPL